MGEQTRINGAAIILAGGEGTRLVGGEYPKALMRLVITPVIEILTDKLLQRDPRLRIYVVTREKWRHDFDRWLEHYERRLKRRQLVCQVSAGPIKLVFEETTLNTALLPRCTGTLSAIYLTLEYLRAAREIAEDALWYVFNADNYLDDDLDGFFRESENWLRDPCCFCVNAAWRLADYRDAWRFGVIIHERGDPRIVELIEKPAHPTAEHDLVSTGCYALRNDAETRRSLHEFLLRECESRELNATAAASATGDNANAAVDIAVFLRERILSGRTARYIVLKGAWFDVGTPTAFVAALEHYIARNIDVIRTVGDLEGRTHGFGPHHHHLLVVVKPHNLTFTDTTLTISFHRNDPVATGRQPGQHASWIDQIAPLLSSPGDARGALISPIQQALGTAQEDGLPMYLSGGLLLVDTNDTSCGLSASKSRIPLQRRDFGACVDPDRLTMPAGALDRLSLSDCCYLEMQEEFLCYGDKHGHRVLFYLFRPYCRGLSKQEFLERVLDKDLPIPGIDRLSLRNAKFNPEAMRRLIEEIVVTEYDLAGHQGQPNVWEIVIKLDDREMDRGWFFVTLEQQMQTLECRKIAWANLSGVSHNKRRHTTELYGRLAGIADGDGHGRLPVVFGADSLIDYRKKMDGLSREKLIDHIFSGPDDLLRILCSGEAGSGRFNRFDFPIPVVTTTPSVGDMLRFLGRIFRP